VSKSSKNTPQVIGAGLAVSTVFTGLCIMQGNDGTSLLRRLVRNACSAALLGASIGGALMATDRAQDEDSLVVATAESMILPAITCAGVSAAATIAGTFFWD